MPFPKIAIIMLEGQSGGYTQGRNVANVSGLMDKYQSMTNYTSGTLPSLPGYLKIVTGSTLGHNGGTGADSYTTPGMEQLPDNANNLLAQLDAAAGLDWRSFAQGWDGNVGGVKYAKRHDPATFFVNTVTDSRHRAFNDAHGTGLKSTIAAGASAFPDGLSFIIPNLNNDGHDTASMTFVGNWLVGNNPDSDPINEQFPGVEALLTAMGPTGVVCLIWDDAGSRTAKEVAVICSPGNWPNGRIGAPDLTAALNHADLLYSLQRVFGLPKFSSTNTTWPLEADYTTGVVDFNLAMLGGAGPPLNALLAISPGLAATVGDTVTADATGSTTDGTNAFVGYTFDWGDGTVQGGPSTNVATRTHIYSTPGTYSVSVTVTDAVAATDVDTKVMTVTAIVGDHLVRVVGPGGTGVSSLPFVVTVVTAPSITSFSPASGLAASTVVITGLRFTGATQVTFNNIPAAFTVLSATSISATVPAGGGGLIKVSTPAGIATSATAFVLTSGPTVTSFLPLAGPVGTVVTFTGTNLATVSLVHFGSAAIAPTSANATTVVVTVPAGASTGRPVLDTPSLGSAVAASTFTVNSGISAPTISSFSPLHAAVGAAVTIFGTNFTSVTNVDFNGVAAAFTVTDATHIAATVPAGGSGPVVVTNPGGVATSAASFAIDPTLSSFTPASGPTGTVVTITGSGFLETLSARVGGISVQSLHVVSDTTLQITVAGGGSGTIVVTTRGGSVTSSGSFAWEEVDVTEFTVTYYGSEGWSDHTFEVIAVETAGAVDQTSSDNPEVVGMPKPVGIWLMDGTIAAPGETVTEIQLLGQEPAPSGIGESATVFTPIGRRDPITVTDSVRGYEGTVAGLVQTAADLAVLEQMKADCAEGGNVRVAMGDMNIVVQIGALTINRVPTEAGLYEVSVEVKQTDDFSVPMRHA